MKPTCKVNVELRLVKRRTQADYIVDPFFQQQKRGRKFTSHRHSLCVFNYLLCRGFGESDASIIFYSPSTFPRSPFPPTLVLL